MDISSLETGKHILTKTHILIFMAVLPAVTQTGGKKQNVHQQVNGKSNDGIKQQNTTQQQKEKNY